MSQNVSILHTTVTVNGHVCEGWAAVADALTFPDITLSNSEVGPDGLRVASSTGMRGGVVGFKFQSNSRSRAQFSRWSSQVQKGATIIFEGSWSNAQTGENGRLDRGTMETMRPGTTLGNAAVGSQDFMINFESVVGNYDSLRSTPIPVNAS